MDCALLEEPAHDRAAFDLEAVQGTREEQRFRRISEVVGDARPRLAETSLRVSPHLCDESLILREHRRRRDFRGIRTTERSRRVTLSRRSGWFHARVARTS